MTLENILVSAIVPNYNRREKVKVTINSLLNQTISDNYEIIVVDDGSTDGAVDDLLTYYAREIDQGVIKVVPQENGGVCSARNNGIDHAKGKYVAFCDADDISLPQRLESQVTYLETQPEKQFVHGKARWIDGNGKLLNDIALKTEDGIPEYYNEVVWPNLKQGSNTTIDMLIDEDRNPIHTSSVMVDRNLLLNLKERDGHVFDLHLKNVEDGDLWRKIAEWSRARNNPEAMGFIDYQLINYSVDGNNKSRKDPERQRKTKAAAYAKSHIRSHYNGRDPKLLVLTPVFTGGIGDVTIGQAEALFSLGFTNIDFIKQPKWYGEQKQYSFKKIDSHIFNTDKDDDYYKKGWKPINDFTKLLNDIDIKKYTAVHIQGNHFANEAKEIKKIGVPIMYTCHSLVAHEDKVEERSRPVAQRKQEDIMELADVIQIPTNAYKKIFDEFYPHLSDRVRVIPHGNGVNPHDGYVWKPKKNHILSVGRLDKVKGYETLIKSIGNVAKTNPDVRLTIAGYGPDEEKLKTLVSSLGLENKIHFAGWKSKKGLKELYSQASLYVQPSLHESWALAAHDAAVYGVPVACTNVGGLDELFTHNETSLKFRPEDVEGLTNVLNYSLNNQNYMNKLAEQARTALKDYTWLNTAKKLNETIVGINSANRAIGKYTLAQKFRDINKWDGKALKFFRSAYRLAEKDSILRAQSALQIAQIYFNHSKLDESKEWYNNALRANSTHANLHDLRGKLYK